MAKEKLEIKPLTPAHKAGIDNAKKYQKGPRTIEEIKKDYQTFYQERMAEEVTDIKETIKRSIKDSNIKFRDGLIIGAILSIFSGLLAASFLNWMVYSSPIEYSHSALA